MANIKLKSVYKIYDGAVEAVKDFNLEIKDKEFVVFVGPSGCGKSTTLRMIAGLESITAGDIYIDDIRINDLEPRDRNIAMVFQNYALYPHMTVYKNMAFSLKISKSKIPVYDDTETDRIVAELGARNKELKRLNKLAKKENSDELQATIEKLKSEIDVLTDELIEAKNNRKQLTFIDKQAIKDTKKSIEFYRAQIDELNKYADKTEAKLEANKEKYKGEEQVEKIRLAIDRCRQRAKDFAYAIENEEKILHKLETEEVPMYKMAKLSKNEIDIRVREAAKMLEITELLDRKPKALSGGQRQRVAIGRAVVRNAKVFLMDEPLSNLDAKLRNQMRSELILLRNKINSTFVYVTHDQTEAMTLGDRIVIMKDGVIQQIGTPQDLFNHPVNTFVAGFIGSPQMNFFDAKLNENLDVELLGKLIPTDEKMKENLTLNGVGAQDIVLGVRPEYITLADKEDPQAVEGTTIVKELMGSSIHIHIDTNEGKNIIMVVRILDVGQETIDALKEGEPIYFKWNSTVECLFSKETGENLLPLKENE